MRKFFLTVLTGCAVAAPVMAQDRAPFTGARIEGLAGWDRVKAGGHDDNIGYGVGIGYDMQMGGALLGVEAEASDSNVRDCAGSATVIDPRLCLKTGRDLYAGGRIGATMGSALIYAKLGYTNFRGKFTSNDGTTETTLAKSDLDGVRVGGGAEFALSQNTFVKAEYRYSNYEAGVDRHQAMGGFGFGF